MSAINLSPGMMELLNAKECLIDETILDIINACKENDVCQKSVSEVINNTNNRIAGAYDITPSEYWNDREHPDRDPLNPLMYGGYNYDA